MPKRTAIILSIALVAAFVAIWMFIAHVANPRIIGRAVTPDGTELCIVQEFNWNPELFTTSFVYHRPGIEWRRFYYDHQDIYWGGARVKLDTNSQIAVFYRGNVPAITFHWDSEIYTMHRRSRGPGTSDAHRP